MSYCSYIVYSKPNVWAGFPRMVWMLGRLFECVHFYLEQIVSAAFYRQKGFLRRLTKS